MNAAPATQGQHAKGGARGQPLPGSDPIQDRLSDRPDPPANPFAVDVEERVVRTRFDAGCPEEFRRVGRVMYVEGFRMAGEHGGMNQPSGAQRRNRQRLALA